jgi:ubiquinone/menaquinone biosynthesis C-methylase UbiE
MDIEKYEGPQVDCVILAYVLGHVNAREVVDKAKGFVKPGGRLIVWDLFNTNKEFVDFMEYDSLKLEDFTDLEQFVTDVYKHPVAACLPVVFFENSVPALLVYEA